MLEKDQLEKNHSQAVEAHIPVVDPTSTATQSGALPPLDTPSVSQCTAFPDATPIDAVAINGINSRLQAAARILARAALHAARDVPTTSLVL